MTANPTLVDWLRRPAAHLCLDVQRLFGPDGPWQVPWLERALPAIVRLARHAPAHTVFTRFIPPATPQQAQGAWRDLYLRQPQVTRHRLAPELLDLLAPLAGLVPPAHVLDKGAYSPFSGTPLAECLSRWGIETLIVSGTETDVCVAAAVLHAVDLGLRVVVAQDAVCSSSDATHEALMTAYRSRLRTQVEVAQVADIVTFWQPIGELTGPVRPLEPR